MNIKVMRKNLKRDCPAIYYSCFAYLSDEDVITGSVKPLEWL
jgi:hypothetical protein